MTSVAFHYRPRREKAPLAAHVGDVVQLAENIEYIIEFPVPPSSTEIGHLLEVGYDPISERMGVLAFKNFVGTTLLAGVRLQVRSTKLGEQGVSGLLEQVSQLSSNLVFGWGAPASFASQASGERRSPAPFHQLQLLRDVILRRAPGERLQDYFELVERNPTRRFLLERPVVPAARARNFDARSVNDIFTHPERLVPVHDRYAIKGSPLAVALRMGKPQVEHFPTHVAVSTRRLSYDTAENRFIKHFLAECLSIVYRLLDEQNLHLQMRSDCREMATILEALSRALFLSEAGVLSAFAGPTQALAKAEGYKELLELWMALSAHQSLPTTEADIQRLLQGKDVALLYEYWVFLKVLEAVKVATGLTGAPVAVSRGDLGEGLDRGLQVQLSPKVAVAFNPSFMRSAGTAYSTPLRPDVVVTIGEVRFAFDAKYRLQWLDSLEDVRNEEATFVRGDLYKMHTYRDAITNMRSAFVVYPGTEFMFFERGFGHCKEPGGITTFDGVGAIPAKPDGTTTLLQSLVSALINQSGLFS